jgi:hypothetical protein
MTLSQQYKDYVTPLLGATFRQIICTLLTSIFFRILIGCRYLAQPSADLPSIIQKEALYCAIGCCTSRLKDDIPFDQWLHHTLLLEARETNPK